MRHWIITLAATGLLIFGLWLGFAPAWRMHLMLDDIEGGQHMDILRQGRPVGSYLSEFTRLDNGDFRTVLRVSFSIAGVAEFTIEQRFEFGGFPGFRIRRAAWHLDDEQSLREAHELPAWDLYHHLILQRLVIEGPDLLAREDSALEVLSSERTANGAVRARLTAPVLRPRSARIESTEFDMLWLGEGGASVQRSDGRYRLDASGRILSAQLHGIGELTPSGHLPQNPDTDPPDTSGIGFTLDQAIAHPERIRALRLEIVTGESALLTADEHQPLQEISGSELVLRGGLRPAPEDIVNLVALVHHSLIYDESANATDVEEIIAQGRGDCTEFTDLFAARAEAAGYNVRKVLGLAYSKGHESRREGFHVHAWNQVALDGEWLDVDATWNQASPSAARIRFAQNPTRQLALLIRRDEFQFKLLEVAYASDAQATSGAELTSRGYPKRSIR